MNLVEIYKSLEKNREFLLGKMNIKSQKEYYINSFPVDNELRAIYALKVENDIAKAKNLYYEASIAIDYIVKMLNADPFSVFAYQYYPILSDSSRAINSFLSYKATHAYEKAGAFQMHFGYALQSILSGNMQELEMRIALATKKCQSGVNKRFEGSLRVFEGILLSDVNAIESGITNILKKTSNDSNSVSSKFINLHATALTKLAWRKGFRFEVKTELIPKPLLPFEELKNYESFDFFNEPGN